MNNFKMSDKLNTADVDSLPGYCKSVTFHNRKPAAV